MNERPHSGPLPPTYPVAHGRPPTPDGDRIPQPAEPSPPGTRSERWWAALFVALLLVALVIGVIRG